MTTVFIKLLNMSIAASWLVLAVILIRILLKNAPKWIRCILWGLVAVRLICPISIESIFSLLPSAETIPQDIMYVEQPTIHTGVMAINSAVNPYMSESMAPGIRDSINPMQVVMSAATLIWIVGMIGMFIYAVLSFMRIKNKADASLPVRENIYLSDYIDTPFVLGFLRPRIYLPSALAEDDKAEFVIAHEKAHIRRRDHWWKPLGFLLLTIYWFNPVIWIAYILLCRDIELACDEYVIGSLKEKEKKSYSDALLSCSMRSAGFHRNMISACPLAFGEVGVKDRVKAVLHYKKPAFWLLVVAVLSCIVVAVCFLTDPVEDAQHAPEPFGHSYRVEEIVYAAPQYSFAYSLENAPRYQFSSDYAMFVSGDILNNGENFEWIQQFGAFKEVKLSVSNFDDYLKIWPIGPDEIRKDTKYAWRMDVEKDANDVFYYLILTKNGEVYLTYGYDVDGNTSATDTGDLIRWIFKLSRTDILRCNAVSADCDAYVEPAYYPKGFDWEYDKLPEGSINGNGVLFFTTDWDTDTLIISEDYYHNYDPDNRSNSTFIEKETYALEKSKSGLFELNVKTRSANGDMAVYFIQGPTGVYVMKVLYYEDESALTVPLQEYAPEEILGMTYLDFQKLAGVSPEFYHANFISATIPGTRLTAVFLAEGWDDKNAMAFLEEDDTVIRLEGTLGEILPEVGEKMSLAEFVKDDIWADNLVDYRVEEGAGTAYYVADRYAAVRYDIDGDKAADRELQIALEEADVISPDAYCWLSFPAVETENVVTPEVNTEYVLNQAIHETILNQYKPENPDGLYHCADFVLLDQEEIFGVAPVNSGKDNIELITVYGMALHESFGFSGAMFHEVEFDYVPVKLQFQKESESEYVLKDAWFPDKTIESWDSYQEAIWDTFSPYSEELATDLVYAIQDDIYLTSLRQNCYEQAVSYGAVDTDTVIEGLLEEVVASPGTFASGVKDYIVANDAAYKELIHYGKHTLWYCFGEFLEGGQTDLRCQIMASVCKDISMGWGEALLIDSENPATTGQDWFEQFRRNAEELQKQYSEEEMNELYHASWLLLQLI